MGDPSGFGLAPHREGIEERMRRRAVVFVLTLTMLAVLPAESGSAFTAPHPPLPRQLTVSGFVVGRVAKGNKIRMVVDARDPNTWINLDSVGVVLLLNGVSVQELSFQVKEGVFQLGAQAPVRTTQRRPVAGGFFRVYPPTVHLVRYTFSVRVAIWARVTAGVPPGTTFRAIARDEDGTISVAKLKAEIKGGFLTWGTAAIGMVLALLLGMAIANARWARRHRELRPSIWAILERRLREESTRRGVLAPVPAKGRAV
jgi:hypothetical protein